MARLADHIRCPDASLLGRVRSVLAAPGRGVVISHRRTHRSDNKPKRPATAVCLSSNDAGSQSLRSASVFDQSAREPTFAGAQILV